MQVPAGFTTGLLIEAAPRGEVAVGVARDGVLLGEFTMSPLDIANMAAAMLAASRDASKDLPVDNGGNNAGALVMPSSFTLGPGASAGQESLVLSFGASHLAFSMPSETMQQLGQSMVATASRGSVQ